MKKDEKLAKLLEKLRKDFNLFVHTNSPKEVALKVLEALGIKSFFKAIISPENAEEIKPSKKAFLKLGMKALLLTITSLNFLTLI